jgi:hypothetical protein
VIKAVGYTHKQTGTVVGPTHITIIRPNTLAKKGVFERILDN